ncbi:54S ribosomal protein yml6, mitochondrial [Golovinomyces cichoracearum]|uniref:Large ribosomal subunit protein uL4m n=1 Tax=Golovinomyces cichoracearum TaxID=62708 RepID=A0A420HCJ4_9PEZI|nr:54S ribosomal protein yml6, mitochondrial [Golovinomyces cichoracearum]
MSCTPTSQAIGNRSPFKITPKFRNETARNTKHIQACSPAPENPEVLTTIYQFPTMEPLRFESYSSKHLSLPLRRDILHRAVVFEGDSTRQGTASTKTRFEVHGSHRKIRPQKGTGKARLGHRQSPAIVGGGVVFGPKPRDFSTRLPRKIYDLAWRTALSWRYRRGELIVCEDDLEIKFPDPHYLKHILEHNHWGKPNGRSLFVVNGNPKNLIHAMNNAGEDGKVRTVSDLDVKNLLEMGRVVIEKRALDMILDEHQSDLKPRIS